MSQFRHEIEPPPALEERVVAALRSRGLLRQSQRRRGVIVAVAAAAAVLCIATGYAAGRWHAGGVTPPAYTGPEFMLLLHYTPALLANPAPVRERVDAYRRWAQQVDADGYGIRGAKLKDASGETLAGFFIVQAPSREAAEAIAATCPHARLGGRVEIRELDPT